MRTTTPAIAPLALMLALAMSACATTKQAQVRTALLDAGLSKPMADCMAEPLGRDLSINQLKSLQRVARVANGNPARMTTQQVMNLFRRDLDPETVGVVVRAGVGCFVRG